MADAGITIAEKNRALASIQARRGQADAVAAAIAAAYDLDLPRQPRWTGANGISFAWAGPGQWTAIATRPVAHDLMRQLAGLAAVTDQSDGWVLTEVSGPRGRDALAKMLPIDLHPAVLPPGSVALTRAGHIDVRLRHLDAGSYELAVFRSLGADFAGWLRASALEFGIAP
jgi:sarcosine oxidase subunit gamma